MGEVWHRVVEKETRMSAIKNGAPVEAPRGNDVLTRLTTREREVLALMAMGRTDRGISRELFVTRKTVETHTRNIFRKFELPTESTENRRVHAVLVFLGLEEPKPHR
jgi:DNA-binding NarL/FixJ family response regulator